MATHGSRTGTSPLAAFLRARTERALAAFEAAAGAPPGSTARRGLERFLRALDEVAAAADALGAPADPPAQSPSATILVSSDSAFAGELQLRAGAGMRVVVVAGGKDPAAIRAALEEGPSLVVGAGAGGVALIQRVREVHPLMPAIFVAAGGAVSGSPQAFAADPVVVLRSPSVDELELAIRALLATPPRPARPVDAPEPALPSIEPRSYAHLAGLLPRALERTVPFDVGAAVVDRPGAEPLVDVYATGDCPAETLEWVRRRALALYDIVRGGARDEPWDFGLEKPPSPLGSSMYYPIASGGAVVGLTYLGAVRAGAFTPEEEGVLASLVTHASGAYRGLEASLHELRLSPRQSQVLALIASGLSDKEVASRLGLAHRTVRTHVDRMLREHGLRSRTEAVAAWLRGQQG